MLKIEIGGGKKKRGDGYQCCDIRDIAGVEHVCAADNLPFENNSVDEVYSRHIIEHFTLQEFLQVLVEWNRVLKVGGTLYIICPNLLWHLQQILTGDHQSLYRKEPGQNDRYWGFGSLFGWQQDEYDVHKFGYYFELLRDVLQEAGFAEIKNLTNTEESLEQAIHHLEVSAQKVQPFTDPSTHSFSRLFDVTH